MALKNYTSSIPASRSIAYIEGKLVSSGAEQIVKYYEKDTQRVKCICFIMNINGQEMAFKVPAQVANCEKVLRSSLSSRARPETIKKVAAQAERTAWKIVSDWVEVQMAMIELSQVEFMEVFMSYLYDPIKNETLFQRFKQQDFQKLLT